MRSNARTAVVSILLMVSLLITSAVTIIEPRTAYAQTPGVPTGEVPFSLLTLKNILTEVNTWLTQINTYAAYVNTYVLQPAALIKSGNLLKAMTSGVIMFVTGKANGTGASQFVQDLQGNLQKVGDTQAIAFFAQFGRNSNSPFSSSIVSSLRTNYLQQTSSAGFWAANRSTLYLASPNVNAFLGGNWSSGGVKAWFSLTTQPQNNPYALYQASQSQLSSVVTGATAARQQALNWGQGFLSWCGPSAAADVGPLPGPCAANATSGAACTTPAGIPGTCAASELGTECVPKVGVNPGDSCYNSDGTAGTIKTPGSVISSSLSKVLGANQDKLVQIGSVAKDIGGIMGNLASIWQTVQFAQQVLGGSNSGGLYGLGQNAVSNPNTRPNDPSAGNPGSNDPVNSARLTELSGRIEQFSGAWNTIKTSAENASTSVQSLIEYCMTQPGSSRSTIAINDGQSTLRDEIAPVFAKVSAAARVITAARTALTTATTTDAQGLINVPPTGADVAAVQYDAQSHGGASANPAGSLIVSGGTTVDQMNLISSNASSLKNSCAPTGTNTGNPGDPNGGGG